MQLQKKLRPIILSLLAGVLLLYVAARFGARYIEDKTRELLATIPFNVSTVDANILTRTIELRGVDWTQANDSLPQFPHHLFVNMIRLEGISVYQLLAKKQFNIDMIVLDKGELLLNRNLKHRAEKNKKTESPALKGLAINRIVLRDIYTKITTDSLIQYEGAVTLSVENVVLDDFKKILNISSYAIKSFEADITHITVKGRKGMYDTKISRISANSLDKKIEIDSIVMIPLYSRFKFSRKVGRQVDRYNLLIPKILINEFKFDGVKDSLFQAGRIELKSAKLHVYRDKRLPFIKEKNTPLPIAMIRELDFEMAIDSLRITDANITYEEFPEKGYHTGQVSFAKLNATLDHVTNRNHYPDYKQATLKVSTYVMGKGLLNVEFSLPYGKSQVYNAKGSLSNFFLYRLNPVLENLAFVSVTSGKLNQLKFNFDYNDQQANGDVLVNYEDLKINTLTKEKDPETNELKTLVVNTFLKNDKTSKTDMEKRTGTIDYQRDRKRSIFHYWWKSLLTGIKSSVVDRPTKEEKEKKKEERREK